MLYCLPHSVDDGSVAAQQGVTVGDQVLQANGQAFVGISHAEAVAVIRQTNQLDLLLKVFKRTQIYIKEVGSSLFLADRTNTPSKIRQGRA